MASSDVSLESTQVSSTSQAERRWYDTQNVLGHRRRMIRNITRMFEARARIQSTETDFSRVVRRLEQSLLYTSESIEEYQDSSTLKRRLVTLAMAIGVRVQQQIERAQQDDSSTDTQQADRVLPDQPQQQQRATHSGTVAHQEYKEIGSVQGEEEDEVAV